MIDLSAALAALAAAGVTSLPTLAFVLGSGLGPLADEADNAVSIPYTDIPGFPKPSVAGHKVRAGGTIYSATKSAVRVISEGLRQEVKPYNIRTTIISPGAVASELPDSITDHDIGPAISKFYQETAISADSFASMVIFAISQPEDVDVNEILFRPTRQEY